MSTTLRISKTTVCRMVSRGERRAFRLGGQLRVTGDSVVDLLRRGE